MANSFFTDNVVHFFALLRRAGLSITPTQSADAFTALTLIDITNREHVYHTLRAMLVNRQQELGLFDAAFGLFWRNQKLSVPAQSMPLAPRHKRPKAQALAAMLMAQKAGTTDHEREVVDKAYTFSASEKLQVKKFGEMTPDELAAIQKMIQTMRWEIAQRTTRRYIPDKSGNKLHLRKVMRHATKHGGIPFHLTYQNRKINNRPIILIADISGSMETYARLLLQFFYALSQSQKQTEVFVFGTRLTRITDQLKTKNIDIAIDVASRQVLDWAGGTRIGDSLHEFNRVWAKRVVRRGAITVVVSDGCDRGEPERLATEMRFLQHRTHRLIWLNPHLGHTAFSPESAGMSAALPFIDDFLPVHNFQSLEALALHLKSLNKRATHGSPLPKTSY